MLQYEKDNALSADELARKNELETLIGAPLSGEAVNKMVADLNKQLADLTAKTANYKQIRDLLSKLQSLKD